MTTLRYDAAPIYHAGGDVYTQGEYAGISIPSYRLFETNSAEMIPQAEALLDSAISVLKRYPNSNIIITGNTGGLGSHHSDQKLSEARARQVAAYLWAHGINNFKSHNIATRRLRYVGYGDHLPIADISKAANIQRNSRIQITAYPSQEDLKLDKVSRVFNNMGGYSDL
jgi:outer membrane protein OmpA-like peptidoglycan-associated protein